MYRDASHLWRSFSHNRTKINIQFLNEVPSSKCSQLASRLLSFMQVDIDFIVASLARENLCISEKVPIFRSKQSYFMNIIIYSIYILNISPERMQQIKITDAGDRQEIHQIMNEIWFSGIAKTSKHTGHREMGQIHKYVTKTFNKSDVCHPTCVVNRFFFLSNLPFFSPKALIGQDTHLQKSEWRKRLTLTSYSKRCSCKVSVEIEHGIIETF